MLPLLLATTLVAQDARPDQAADSVAIPEVETRGDRGPTVLLIGCMSCRWKTWEPFMRRNADRYRLVAVTLPGFGGTPIPPIATKQPGALWHDAALAALEALLRERGLQDVTIIGHSFGGFMATQLAARYPDRISRVVAVDAIVATTFRGVTGETHEQRLSAAAAIIEGQAPGYETAEGWRRFNRPPAAVTDPDRRVLYHGMFMATPREVVTEYWRENLLRDLNVPLGRLTKPLLNVRAYGVDRVAAQPQFESHLAVLASVSTEARVTTVAAYGSGHFLHEQHPIFFDELVRRFVAAEPLSGIEMLLPRGAEWK